jgi:hypothetical protein
MFEDLVPIVALLLVFGIPIIAILTAHQQKMAKLIHGQRPQIDPAVIEEIRSLRTEVSQLQDRVNTMMLDQDTARKLAASPPPVPQSDPLEQRLGG